MAQFIPFSENVEVNGYTVLSVVNGVNNLFKTKMLEILAKNNIENPQPENWYKQTDWLRAFKEISQKIGENTLFSIGKSIPENAIFPSTIDNLEKALASIDIAYKQNHRGGEIGYYKLASYDEAKKEAVMECFNPYPCHFDRGIITTMTRKFAPLHAVETFVVVDNSKPSRLTGSDTSWYIINW